MTPNQREALDYIRDYYKRRQISPTGKEISAHLKVNPGTVTKILRQLERNGQIRYTPGAHRSAVPIEQPRPYEQMIMDKLNDILGRLQELEMRAWNV